MGRRTQGALELMGIQVYRADAPAEVREIVSAAFDTTFLAGQRAAVLLGQSLIGRKRWVAEEGDAV